MVVENDIHYELIAWFPPHVQIDAGTLIARPKNYFLALID